MRWLKVKINFIFVVAICAIFVTTTNTLITTSCAVAQENRQKQQDASPIWQWIDSIIAFLSSKEVLGPLLVAVVALSGTIVTALFQRASINKQIAAQKEGQKNQFEQAMENQLREFKEEMSRRKEDEDKKKHSLIVAISMEIDAIAEKTKTFADQVRAYDEITNDNIERYVSLSPHHLISIGNISISSAQVKVLNGSKLLLPRLRVRTGV